MNGTPNSQLSDLAEKVIAGGYCIGCGACAAISHRADAIEFDPYGRFCPDLKRLDPNSPVMEICPFSDRVPNEDELAEPLFGRDCRYDARLGFYRSTYAGFISEGTFRQQGSSGGMGTWLPYALHQAGLIDGAIHIQPRTPTAADPCLFRYGISSVPDAICAGAKSRYYPIEMSRVLTEIRRRPGRYAIVGLPCFVKAVRLLARHDAVVRDRISFGVALVCGHLKSSRFAEMFAWQCGLPPGSIIGIDFRKKMPGQPANDYGVEIAARLRDQQVTIVKSRLEFYGYPWGFGFFKYSACDYCDDVLGETADATVGDAWLPQYKSDPEGTNILVVRNPVIDDLVRAAESSGRLKLDPISPDQTALSQEASLQHRRDGLAYRLYLKDQEGVWRPPKRVEPKCDHLDQRLKDLYRVRIELAALSHEAFQRALQAGDFSLFRSEMDPLVQIHHRLRYPNKSATPSA